MNSKKSLALCLPLAVASSLGFADTYRTELSLGFEGAAYEGTDLVSDFVAEGAQGKATIGLGIYFSEVSTDKGPYAEAAFLDKASSVTLTASYAEYEEDEDLGIDPVDLDFDPNTNDIQEETFYDNFNSASLRVVFGESISLNLSGASNGRQAHAIGFYLNDDMELLLGYEKIDDGEIVNNTAFPLSFYAGQAVAAGNLPGAPADAGFTNPDVKVEVYQEQYTLGVNAVQPLSGEQSVAYSGHLAAIDGSSGDGFGAELSTTYYFTNAIGLGIDLAYDKFDSGDLDVTDIKAAFKASYYITPSYSVSAKVGYAELEFEDTASIESTAFSISGAARF